MGSSEKVVSVLPSIYDASIDAGIWGDTLEGSAHALGAKGALLLIIERHSNPGMQVNHFSKIWSRAPERAAMYNERFFHYEKPVWDKLSSSPKQNLILDTEFWKDEPDLINRPDYQYLKENVGIVHKCAARLNDNMSWWDTLVVHFDEKHDHIPEKSVRDIQLILPHVAKSVELARAFEQLKKQYQAVLAALDHVEIGLCVAQQDGAIVVKNSEADRILADRDGIRLSDSGKLFIHDTECNAQLQLAIDQVSQTAVGENTTHELLFMVDRKSKRQSFLIEVAPLRDYAEELGSNVSGALVTLIDPFNSKPFSVELAALAYQLTDAESVVCKLLVEGRTTNEMADIRNVSPETIKSQVKSVLNKTSCARRSDLIRLVLKTTPPIRQAKSS